MIARIELDNQTRRVDLNKAIDISIPLRATADNPNAFGLAAPRFEPFKAGDFVGSVQQGGPVNCEDLFINAHGNGTHTECVGHIARERITINQSLKQFVFLARLITVTPQESSEGDKVITADMLKEVMGSAAPPALIVRTLPNDESKCSRQWSGNNPPYFEASALSMLRERGVEHLLTDLPSVDREQDEGALAGHHAWWDYPANPRLGSTITEMVYVADGVADGEYLLNIQITALETDASPSKPVLYAFID